MELEELFHYDVLVTCPPHFNVTFSLPNWSSRPDRTFDVLLDDAHSTYRVFVTTITFHDHHHHDDEVRCDPDTPSDDVVASLGLAVRWWSMAAVLVVVLVSLLGVCGYVYLDTIDHTRPCQASSADIALTGSRLLDHTESMPANERQVTLTGSCPLTESRPVTRSRLFEVTLTGSRLSDHTSLTGSRMLDNTLSSPANQRQLALTGSRPLTGSGLLDHTSRSQSPAADDRQERHVAQTGSGQLDHPVQRDSSPANERQVTRTGSGGERRLSDCERSRRRRRRLVVVHVLLRLVFALSCTFTACSMLFYASQRQRLDDVSQLHAVKRRFDVAVSAARDQLVDHAETRPLSDVARVQQMQLACDG